MKKSSALARCVYQAAPATPCRSLLTGMSDFRTPGATADAMVFLLSSLHESLAKS
jgi:hypothetical protein